jgi:3-mercaptopyruvate sulfurtransferase SseA
MTDLVKPAVLVSMDWVAEHLSENDIRVVEVDEEAHSYAQGAGPHG